MYLHLYKGYHPSLEHHPLSPSKHQSKSTFFFLKWPIHQSSFLIWSSDASPPLFKCGCSGFRRSGKLMGVDMLYWIQRLLCFEACVHNYLNFFGLLNPHCQAFLFRVLFNIFWRRKFETIWILPFTFLRNSETSMSFECIHGDPLSPLPKKLCRDEKRTGYSDGKELKSSPERLPVTVSSSSLHQNRA